MFEGFMVILWIVIYLAMAFVAIMLILASILVVTSFIGYIKTMSKNHGKMREDDDGTL